MQTFTTKSLVLGLSLALLGSTTAAFAQAGGPDTPTDAKMQGAKENGASSVGEKGAMKSGSMSSMKKHHSKKMHHSM